MTNPILKILGQDATAPAWASAQRTAASGISGISSLIPGLSAALSAAGMLAFAKQTLDAGDALHDMSQKTGLSVETLSKWKFVAEQSNATLESIQPGLKGLAKNMEDAARGGKDSADAFARLGVPVRDNAGNLRQMDAVMLDLADKFSRMPDGAQKTALALRVFGKAGQEMIPILNQGTAGIADLMDTAEQLGLVMSSEAAASADEMNDSLNLLKQSSTALATQLLNHAAPAVSQIARAMAEAARDGGFFAAAMAGYSEAWKTWLGGTGSDQLRQQRLLVSGLQQEVEMLEKALDMRKKSASVIGPDPAELQRKLDAAILSRRSALEVLERLEAQANKPLKAPNVDVNPTVVVPTGKREDPETAAAKAAREHAKAIREKMEWLKQEADYQQRSNDAIADAIAVGNKQQEMDRDRAAAARLAMLERQQQEENDAAARMAAEQQRQSDEATSRLIAVMDSARTESSFLDQEYIKNREVLQQRADEDYANRQFWNQRIWMLEKKWEQDKTALEDAEIKKRFGIANVYRKADLNSASFFANQMAGLMQTNSRKLFEVGKAAAIASAIIDTYKAATGAYAALASIPIIGPALGAAAAAAIAIGMARVQAIRSQQFGAGSGAVGTFAANPSTGLPESPTSSGFSEPPPSPLQQPVAALGPTTVHVSILGDSEIVSLKWVRESLVPMINEASADRVRIII